MSVPIVSIIAAVAKNLAIGKNNQLLWHLPEDLKRFKSLTIGHPIIMGQRTFESIGRALPGRTNIVVSDKLNYQALGCQVAHSLEEALRFAMLAQGDNEIFIIGGGMIYKQAINLADKLYLTLVDGEFEADTFFPDYAQFKRVIYQSEWMNSGSVKYQFLELKR